MESKIIWITAKSNKSFALLFLLTLVVSILNGYLFIWLHNYLGFKADQSGLESLSHTVKIITVLLVAPLLETWLFQYIPIELTMRYTKRKTLAVAMSAILFACVHCYNVVYIAMALIGGIILALFYLYSKKQNKSPFLATFLLHFCYNLYVMFS